MSLFKVCSRGKGLGNVAMHREEVRRGREGNMLLSSDSSLKQVLPSRATQLLRKPY